LTGFIKTSDPLIQKTVNAMRLYNEARDRGVAPEEV